MLPERTTSPASVPVDRAASTALPPTVAVAPTVGLPVYVFVTLPQEPGEIGRLGQYRVLSKLGEGGMAIVFAAEDTVLCRAVALKVMKPELTADPGRRQRFLREAQAMARVEHDHVIAVYQVGETTACGMTFPYLSMPLLQGESLAERLRRDSCLPVPLVLQLASETARGLEAAHAKGLIHRDIKPANLWLESSDANNPELMSDSSFRVKILDFGLARHCDASEPLTESGTVMGTPHYMAPEQAEGQRVDVRADLFSLGAVLYEAAAGKKAFNGPTIAAVLKEVATREPASLGELNPDIPTNLSRLVSRLLSKDAASRPASAAEVRQELERIESGLTIPSSSPELAGVRHRSSQLLREASRGRSAKSAQQRWVFIGLAVWLLLFVATLVNKFGVPTLSPTSSRAAPLQANDAALTFLTEIPFAATENWPFVRAAPRAPPGEGQPPGEPSPDAGQLQQPSMRVEVNGVASPHGIFMHPPRPPDRTASISYRLDKQYRTFQAQVGLNDFGPPECSPLNFTVYGDGKELWRSKPVSAKGTAQSCAIDVANVNVLKIAVTVDGHPQGAHAVWIEPRVGK